jgi:transcriptional regulator with XRE-family HTH domain
MRNISDATWGDWVSTRRVYADVTPSELARLAGVSRATIYRWQAGDQSPESPEMVRRVAQALGAPLDEAMRAAGMHPDVMQEPARGTSPPAPHWHPVVVELDRILTVLPEQTAQDLIRLVEALIAPYRRRRRTDRSAKAS